MDAREYLEKTKKAHASEVDMLEYLLKIYPDLEIVTDRWGKKYYCSREVNKIATAYHTWHTWHNGHGCGYCEDFPLPFNPYVKHGSNTYVYASPLKFISILK